MAAAARDLVVPSCQRILSLVVIESRRRLPSLFAMTSLAGIADLSAVLVEVTSTAPGGQAEVCFPMRLLSEKGQNRLAMHQALLVALVALHLRVLAEQREANLLMVKGLLWFHPVDQCKVSPLMLVVAALTGSLRGREVAVKAGAAGELGLELGMAREALVRWDLLASGVALGAVVQAFQIGVGLGQGTR